MAATKPAQAKGTPDDPWVLKTPPPASEFTKHRYVKDGENFLECRVGKTVLLHVARYLGHLHAMLHAHGNRMELGSAAAANWPKRQASFSRRFARCFSCAGDWPS
ncbi:MAG: hypothetical protein H7305_15635 [Gemmatimonadaceae bacterium]|nr:hypothetical protein [Gemmatimonadaceae bacterium]